MSCAVETQPVVVGDTVDFTLSGVKKNGIVWDITGGTVLLYIYDPSGNLSGPHTATITDGPGGNAHFQVDDTELDESGDWYFRWKVTVGSIELWSRKFLLSVED